MLSDKLEEWALAYEAKGVQKGEILSLQKLLTKRFGPTPTEITAQIANATLQEIERWFDRAIDTNQLSDVFDF